MGPPRGTHEHHGHHHHHDGFKIEYMCSKNDGEEEIEEPIIEPAFKLRSTHRVEDFTDEPFLSSAKLKCDGSKMIADAVQVNKACASDNFSLTCDANGVDARIIVLKFMEDGAP